MPAAKPLTVTILSPDPRIPGGVAVFIEVMRRAMDRSVETSHFLVGRRATDRSALAVALNPLLDAFRLARHLLFMRPDAVHINPSLEHKSLFRDGLFLLVMRLLRKREVFMFIHGWDEDLSAAIAANPVWRALFRFVYGWPRITVVLAGRFRDQMLAMGFMPEQIHVDSAMFDHTMFDGLTRKRHEDHRLVFVSRLVKGKGVWEALEAYTALKPRYPTLSLYIVGDGPERKRLVQAIAERGIPDVVVRGYLSTAEKAQILLDGDIFVYPTTYAEGCPAALLEAMAAGMPCVTTGVGGIPDVFVDGDNGIMLDDVAPRTIAAAITELLDDAQRMADISEHNKRRAWEKYEARSVTRRIARRYFEVVAAQ
jgi:glycosyltransferase involved in cell wall biosynthesis